MKGRWNTGRLLKRITAALLSAAMVLSNLGLGGTGAISSRADTVETVSAAEWSASAMMEKTGKTELYDAVKEYYTAAGTADASAGKLEIWSRGAEADFADISFREPVYSDGNKSAAVEIEITPADADTKINFVRTAGYFGNEGYATLSDATEASPANASGSNAGRKTWKFLTNVSWNDPAFVIYYTIPTEDKNGKLQWNAMDSEWVAEDEGITEIRSAASRLICTDTVQISDITRLYRAYQEYENGSPALLRKLLASDVTDENGKEVISLGISTDGLKQFFADQNRMAAQAAALKDAGYGTPVTGSSSFAELIEAYREQLAVSETDPYNAFFSAFTGGSTVKKSAAKRLKSLLAANPANIAPEVELTRTDTEKTAAVSATRTISFINPLGEVPVLYNGGKIWADDSTGRLDSPADGGAGTADPTPYNLSVNTDMNFRVHYIAFSHDNGDNTAAYGDQKLVIDLPAYGFALANMPAEGTGIKGVTAYDRNNKVTTSPAAAVKLVLQLDMAAIAATGNSGWHWDVQMKRAVLSNADCAAWLADGKLTTKFRAAICMGDDNHLLQTGEGSNSPEYIWNLSPENYQTVNIPVTGNHTLLTSTDRETANYALQGVNSSVLYDYIQTNKDFFTYTQGTLHDNNTPLMQLKRIKIYIPRTAAEAESFKIRGFMSNGTTDYAKEVSGLFTIGSIQDDNDGKGAYIPLVAKENIYNNGSADNWADAVKYGFRIAWILNDGVAALSPDTLYTAADPEFDFQIPDGNGGAADFIVSGSGQGTKIQTFQTVKKDMYSYNYLYGGYRLSGTLANPYTSNGVSADAHYSNVSYAAIYNGYSLAKDSSGKWVESFPNNNGATVETYEFPKEIQPGGWNTLGSSWDRTRVKIGKIVYWTEDAQGQTQEHTEVLEKAVYLWDGMNGSPSAQVDFDTSAGRVTKVQVYWDYIIPGTSGPGYGSINARSRFNIYVTPEASGLMQVGYSAQCTDSSAGAVINPNDSFSAQAAEDVPSPLHTGNAAADFMWVTTVEKPCTRVEAFPTPDKTNYLLIKQFETGTYGNDWMLYFNYGTAGAYKKTAVNPRIRLNLSTRNITGLNPGADEMGLLTGKFTAGAALSGWKIKYTTADNMTGTESGEQVYTVGTVTDGTEIDLGIDRSRNHLASLELVYEGTYPISDYYTEGSDGKVRLFQNIQYEMRNTNWKGEPLTQTSITGGNLNYHAGDVLIILSGQYWNDDCTDYGKLHGSGNGQSFGGYSYTGLYPYQYGFLFRHYTVKNLIADNLISGEADADTLLKIAQAETASAKVTFRTKAWTKESWADINSDGSYNETSSWSDKIMPWTVPESAYVEITDNQFAPDVNRCKFLGYDNASGKVKIEKVTDADNRVWIKMSVTDQMTGRDYRTIGTYFTNAYGKPTGSSTFMQDAVVIAVKSYPTTSVTNANNHHRPFGSIYYDVSSIETTLDGSKARKYSYAELDGDLYTLPSAAAAALKATAKQKLFSADLSNIEVNVGLKSLIGANLYPGKGEYVEGTSYTGDPFPAVTFYPDEKNRLTSEFLVQAPSEDGIHQFSAVIKIPEKGDAVSYTNSGKQEEMPVNQYSMHLTGPCTLVGDSRPGVHDYFYSTDEGKTFTADVSGWTASDWHKVTHVKLFLDEMKKDSKVDVGFPLQADGKTTPDDLSACIGGTYSYLVLNNTEVSGLINPGQYIQGSYLIRGASGSVWKDTDEDGINNNGEVPAGGIKLELYSPDADISDFDDNTIRADTLISSTVTAEDGSYLLRSYIPFAGQQARIIMPDDRTVLTKLTEETDVKVIGDSNFTRDKKTAVLPELPKVSGSALEGVGAGLVVLPVITAENVLLHVGTAKTAGNACNAACTCGNPLSPVLPVTFATASNADAEVDESGSVTAKRTGMIRAVTVSAENTLGDKVTASYDVEVFNYVFYDKNTGTGEVPSDPKQYYPSADAETDTVSVREGNNLSKTGYLFTGWASASDAESFDYAAGSSFEAGSRAEDITLYAVWSPISYTVRFRENGGTGTMEDEVFRYDAAQELEENRFVRAGYHFLGWNTDRKAAAAIFADGQKVLNLTAEDGTVIDFYAVWAEDDKVILKYVSSNPDFGTVSPAAEAVAPATGDPAGSDASVHNGYKLVSWTDESGTAVGSEPHFTPGRTEGIYVPQTYTANFAPITYTVKFDKNGADGTESMDDEHFDYNEDKPLSANLFTATGRKFLGWSTEKNASSAEYADAETVKNLSEKDGDRITLYAVWKNTDPKITQDPPVRKTVTVKNGSAGFGTGEDYTYTFTMVPDSLTAPMPAEISGVTVYQASDNSLTARITGNAAGTYGVEFGLITFTKPGVYSYTLSETKGNNTHFRYDGGSYTMKVAVEWTDETRTELKKTVTYTKSDGTGAEAMTFTNEYNRTTQSGGTGGGGSSSAVPSGKGKVYTIDTPDVPLTVIGPEPQPLGGNEAGLPRALPKTGEEWNRLILILLLLSGMTGAFALLIAGYKKRI